MSFRLFTPGQSVPPSLPGNLVCVPDESAGFDAIALFDKIEPDTMDRILDDRRLRLAPVADFAGNQTIRRDFAAERADPQALAEMTERFSDITRELSRLPDLGSGPDAARLTVLAFAHTRAAPLAAAWNPALPEAVWYPMLGPVSGLVGMLEDLVLSGLLRRRFFQRLHACGRCRSHRLNAYESCPDCGSGNLHDEDLVHHFSCGCHAPESAFEQNWSLVCPKCRRKLEHYGVDYAKPGEIVVCRDCSDSTQNPDVSFACMDCAAVSEAEHTDQVDWYHYDITPDGVSALMAGALPSSDLDDLISPHNRSLTRREFALLASESLKVAERYQRPLTIARIEILNRETLNRDEGALAADRIVRRVVDLLGEDLRDPDLFTAYGSNGFVVLFPETDEAGVRAVLSRFKAAVRDTIDSNVALDAEVISRPQALQALQALQ